MFSLRRFCRLASVQWAEQGRSYIWFLGICVAIHLCIWLLATNGGKRAHDYELLMQQGIFIGGYLITGALFALRYFSALSERDSALTHLMRPASAFEKFLLAFLTVAVAYPLAYTLAFQICNLPGSWTGDAVRDARLAAWVESTSQMYRDSRERLANLEFGPYLPFSSDTSWKDERIMVLLTTALQALVLAGGLYFRKLAWLKTVVALFALVVLAIPLLAVVTGAAPSLLFGGYDVATDTLHVQAWLVAIWGGVPVLLWASVFFFHRERELQ